MSRAVRRTDRTWLWDLGAVIGLVVLATLSLLVPGVPWTFEWLFGLALVLVLPGYALVSALMPWSSGQQTEPGENRSIYSGDLLRRLALSLPVSVGAVGAVGVLLSATVGIRLVTAVVGISLLTVLAVLLAVLRRSMQAPAGRAAPLARSVGQASWPLAGGTLQTAVLVLALIALTTTVAVAAMAPVDQATYSEFYVLTEDDDGDLVATGYPETFPAGDGHSLYFGIENHEGGSATYDVVVLAQDVGPNGSTTAESQLDRFNVQVDAGERAIVERSVAPERAGEDRRLQFLLYEDGVPADPGPDTADSSLRLWVDVTRGSDA